MYVSSSHVCVHLYHSRQVTHVVAYNKSRKPACVLREGFYCQHVDHSVSVNTPGAGGSWRGSSV